LLFAGVEFHWISIVWFLSLIPITYLFGRVFCGWICHLGALQELLYHPGRLSVFTSIKAVRIMKVLQYLFFIVLVIQLLVQQKIFWCSIDPFLSIFQMMLAYNFEILSAVLVGLLLLTSLVSYRPFCRAVCPVGLVLGWIEKIPGASVLGMKGGCISCTQCSKACNAKAITRKENMSILNNEECIMCGECIDACPKNSIGFFRLSKRNPSKVVCSATLRDVNIPPSHTL
jgi:polyferredoxin